MVRKNHFSIKCSADNAAKMFLSGLFIFASGLMSASVLAETESAEAAAPVAEEPAVTEGQAKGISIIGNQESPTVLNVVPWKSKELSVDPWETQKGPSNSMLNQVLKPLDREELLREVEYFDMLNKKEQ